MPFTLFHVDRHLKRLDIHSQYSVDQIGSDCTRIDLRASVFSRGGGMPPDPPSQFGLCPYICASHKTLSKPAPLIKNIFLRPCSIYVTTIDGRCWVPILYDNSYSSKDSNLKCESYQHYGWFYKNHQTSAVKYWVLWWAPTMKRWLNMQAEIKPSLWKCMLCEIRQKRVEACNDHTNIQTAKHLVRMQCMSSQNSKKERPCQCFLWMMLMYSRHWVVLWHAKFSMGIPKETLIDKHFAHKEQL